MTTKQITPIHTYCNICTKEFDITALDEIQAEEGIDKISFDCPHCKRTFLLYYRNDKIKQLQKTNVDLQERLFKEKLNQSKKISLEQRVINTTKKIKNEMDRLIKKYEGDN